MGDHVWMQWFVSVVNFVSSLFASLNSRKNQNSGGSSLNVPANGAVSISTSPNVATLIIVRNPKLETTDALFGKMIFQNELIGCTMERTAVCIPEGIYRGYKRDSAHFGMRVIGIDVPNRTDIECHPANIPSQLLGCVAIGSTIDGDALDNSRTAFDRMMLAVPEEFSVKVCSQ